MHLVKFRAVDRAVFDAVRDGRKPVETRAATPKYRAYKAAERMRFQCGTDAFEKTIAAVRLFPDIASVAAAYGPAKVVPGTNTLEELTAVYHGFPNYEEKIAEHGLIAFELV